MSASSGQTIGFGRGDREAISQAMQDAGVHEYMTRESTWRPITSPVPYCHKCDHDHPMDGTCIKVAPLHVLQAVRGPDRITTQLEASGLICPSCKRSSCMGKLPDEECETEAGDNDAWRNYLLDPRGHLQSIPS